MLWKMWDELHPRKDEQLLGKTDAEKGPSLNPPGESLHEKERSPISRLLDEDDEEKRSPLGDWNALLNEKFLLQYEYTPGHYTSLLPNLTSAMSPPQAKAPSVLSSRGSFKESPAEELSPMTFPPHSSAENLEPSSSSYLHLYPQTNHGGAIATEPQESSGWLSRRSSTVTIGSSISPIFQSDEPEPTVVEVDGGDTVDPIGDYDGIGETQPNELMDYGEFLYVTQAPYYDDAFDIEGDPQATSDPYQIPLPESREGSDVDSDSEESQYFEDDLDTPILFK